MDQMRQSAADMVAAAFPELDDHQGIVALIDELGFRCGGKPFYPKRILSILTLLSVECSWLMRRTRLAVLKISAGSLDALEEAVMSALDDDRDVMVNAEMRQRNLGKLPPLAPVVTDRSIQKFPEYVLWLMRYLQPEMYACCGPVDKPIDET